MKKFKIIINDVGQRLDKFLSLKGLNFSRAQIQKMIKAGAVVVNGAPSRPHYFLKEGDEVEIKKLRKKEIKGNNKFKPKIIKATDDYLVINKPAGLVVHPADGVKEKTLLDYLQKKYAQIKIVHRLDKETSGLLVVARHRQMYEHLKKQFKKRKIKKIYTALVYGVVEPEQGRITTPLKRNEKGLMVARSDKTVQNAKESATEFEVKKRFMHYALLEISLKTGRTHQIRAHLRSIGHNVVGDQLYKTSSRKKAFVSRQKKDREKLERIFLHASTLGFYDLLGRWVEFKSKLPKGLTEFLKGV